MESHANQFMYTLFNPEICGVYWITFSFPKWMSMDLVNDDNFLATEPRKLVTFAIIIVMVTISSSVINMNHNDTESKLQKMKRNQDFCIYLYPFPGSKRRQRLWTRLEWCKHFLKSQRLQFCSTKKQLLKYLHGSFQDISCRVY